MGPGANGGIQLDHSLLPTTGNTSGLGRELVQSWDSCSSEATLPCSFDACSLCCDFWSLSNLGMPGPCCKFCSLVFVKECNRLFDLYHLFRWSPYTLTVFHWRLGWFCIICDMSISCILQNLKSHQWDLQGFHSLTLVCLALLSILFSRIMWLRLEGKLGPPWES